MAMPFYEMPSHFRGRTPEEIIYDRRENWIIGLSTLGMVLTITACVAGPLFYWQHAESMATDKARANAAFQVGEIVKTRIANFRGMVTDVVCRSEGCNYVVRFNVASMEPQYLGEYELQRAK